MGLRLSLSMRGRERMSATLGDHLLGRLLYPLNTVIRAHQKGCAYLRRQASVRVGELVIREALFAAPELEPMYLESRICSLGITCSGFRLFADGEKGACRDYERILPELASEVL